MLSLPLRISTSSIQLSFQQKTKNPAFYFEPEFRERLSLWAYAAHPRGIFPFTRKDTKGVSKGTPLRYPWGLCPRSNRKRSRSPYVYHESLVHHWGNRRGTSPFCWKSKNQEVFGESLTTFFSQESSPGVQGRGATLQKEQVCRNLSLGQPTKHCPSLSQLP